MCAFLSQALGQKNSVSIFPNGGSFFLNGGSIFRGNNIAVDLNLFFRMAHSCVPLVASDQRSSARPAVAYP